VIIATGVAYRTLSVPGLERFIIITVSTETELVGVTGQHHLEAITVRRAGAETTETLPADGVFIFIGATVETDWLSQEIVRDTQGYLCTGADVPVASWPRDTVNRDPFLLETNVPRIFATGDVRHGSVKRVAAGVGEGSMAIAFIHQALAQGESRPAVGDHGPTASSPIVKTKLHPQ
jgi:thioredoxin reductase (NADPH)